MLNSTYAPQTWKDVQVLNVEPYILGVSGTASASTTTNIDTKINDDCLVRAIRPVLQDMNFGDYIDLYVIDKDGAYFPPNTILKHPIQNYYIDYLQPFNSRYEAVAPYKVLGGLYFRLSYTNSSILVPVRVKINFELLKALM